MTFESFMQISLYLCMLYCGMRVMRWWVGSKKNTERRKRERAARAVAETNTATQLWTREENIAVGDPYSGGRPSDAPDKVTREYLISKHGDNIAAYDSWKSPRGDDGEGYGRHMIVSEARAWDRERAKKS